MKPYEVVEKINAEIFEVFGEDAYSIWRSLIYTTDGFCESIEFLGQAIWDDNCDLYDENDNEIPLEVFVRNSIFSLLDDLFSLQKMFVPEPRPSQGESDE